MGIFDRFTSRWRMPPVDTKAVSTGPKTKMASTVPDTTSSVFKAYIPYFLYKPPYGYPRSVNLPLFRMLAKTPYVFSVIKTICDEASSLGYEIKIKSDVENPERYEEKLKQVQKFFQNPNSNDESWEFIQRSVIRDICEIDSGVIIKVFNTAGELKEIYARDGMTFLKNPDVYGSLGRRVDFVMPVKEISTEGGPYNSPDSARELGKMYNVDELMNAAYFQYGWTTAGEPVPFGKREIVYMIQNSRTDSIYGLSPVEILNEYIQLLHYGGMYNLDYFINSNVPEGMLSVPDAQEDELIALQERFNHKFTVKDDLSNNRRVGHRVPVTSAKDISFVPFQLPPKEMQIIEQQQWFIKILWSCYDDETEILTENGFKLFKELKEEKVARVNSDNFEMDFVLPEQNQNFEYEGNLISFNNRNVDLMVTPNHKMLYNTRDKFERLDKYETIEAKELLNKDIVIPQAVVFKGEDINPKEFDGIRFTGIQWAKFMGFWLGDGWAETCDNRVAFAISKVVYPDVYEKVTSLLKEIGIEWKEQECISNKSDKKIIRLRFSNKSLNRYLRQFGKAYDKFIPREIINSTFNERESFLEYYALADGCDKKYGQNLRYFSMSKKLIEDTQEIVLRQGIASNVNEWNGGYELVVRHSKIDRKKDYGYCYKESITEQAYNGKVYDVTVPEHHFLVVRRNGRISISSNSFGVTPDEMGFVENSNRAVSSELTKVFKRKAIRPICNIFEYHVDTQILPEFVVNEFFGGDWELAIKECPFEFKYKDYDQEEDKIKHEILQMELNMGVKTPEMIAEELGVNINELKKSKEENMQKQIENQKLIGDINGNQENDKQGQKPFQKEEQKVEQKSEEITDSDLSKEVISYIKDVGSKIEKLSGEY